MASPGSVALRAARFLVRGIDYLYDVISALSNESGALPVSPAILLTDLAALF